MARSRNIVVFSDGTGNSSAKLFKTNVWRTYRALDLSEGSGQIAYYDDGVGTSSFRPLAILGGAIGFGLSRNVKDIYAFICRNYQPGDRLYTFGFSRGAFTIRVLIALIASQGLVANDKGERDLARKVTVAFRRYRARYKTQHRLEDVARAIRDGVTRLIDMAARRAPVPKTAPAEGLTVRFAGLWDTVDAYGLPIEEMTDAWDNFVWPLSMRDRDLWKGVERACHALSLDDERNVFHPVLWNEEDQDQNASQIDGDRVRQVWFAGVHGNVGGGYADDSLALIPLNWVLGEAKREGLRFLPGSLAEYRTQADLTGPLNDSRQGTGALYRYNPRLVSALSHAPRRYTTIGIAVGIVWRWLTRWGHPPHPENKGVIIGRPKIHHSVFERISRGTDNYAPLVLPRHYGVVRENGTIVEPGEDFAAEESKTAAAARCERQEAVWNWVWLRRIIYYLTISLILVIVGLPLLAEPVEVETSGWAAGLVRFISSFLPFFFSLWTDYFALYPKLFLTLATLTGVSLLISGWLKMAIADRMLAVWHPDDPRFAGHVSKVGMFSGFVTIVRTSRLYRLFFFTLLKRRLAPTLVLGLLVAIVVVTASRVVFAFRDAQGWECAPSPSPYPAPTTDNIFRPIGRLGEDKLLIFETSNPCWASNIMLAGRTRYRVEITVDKLWKDGPDRNAAPDPGLLAPGENVINPDYAPSDVDLFGYLTGQASWRLALGRAFRRHPGVRWFKPIARVGTTDASEFVLRPLVKTHSPFRLISEFATADAGELFIYVNDAVLFSTSPSRACSWLLMECDAYKNNEGTAILKLRRVKAPRVQDGAYDP